MHGYGRELLDELRLLEKRSDSRTPYLDNIHGYQELGEVDKVQDWAQEMERRGLVARQIESNLDDPPDVLVEIGGSLVGIEVTDLLEYIHERQIGFSDGGKLSWELRRGQVVSLSWHGVALGEQEKAEWEQRVRANPRAYEAWAAWSLEKFRKRLRQIVGDKDRKTTAKKERRQRRHGESALDSRLSANFLLVFTPELYLQRHLEEYVGKTELRRPRNFDRVFLMGAYGREHPVFEVCLSS